MLAMWAYARYSEKPGFIRYLTVLIAFIMGLMSKAMVVTLPFVFLLLDYWPLKRLQLVQPEGEGRRENESLRDDVYKKAGLFRLLSEKAFFFVATGAAVFVSVSVMKYGRIVPKMSLSTALPTVNHVAKTLFHYVIYIGKTFWPSNLVIPYPKPDALTVRGAVGAGLLLLCVTFLIVWIGRRRPYLAVGWLWYLVTLFPVSGIVQGGPPGLADRYTYVPIIGLFIMIAWGVPDLFARWRLRPILLGAAANILIVILMIITWRQVGYWKDSITLFNHAANSGYNNYVAYNNMGVALMEKGRLEEAKSSFSQAVLIKHDYIDGFNNLGVVLKKQGRLEKALSCFSRTLQIAPYNALALNNMAITLSLQDRHEEAATYFVQALQVNPNYAEAHNNLGGALSKQGKNEEAMEHFFEAVRLKPDYAGARNNLGIILKKKGRLEEAMGHFSEAVRIKPDYAEAHNNLGVVLEKQGRLEEARSHFSEALRIKPDYEKARKNLEITLRLMGKSLEESDVDTER
jgi:Flp pilus assembly protein TadD